MLNESKDLLPKLPITYAKQVHPYTSSRFTKRNLKFKHEYCHIYRKHARKLMNPRIRTFIADFGSVVKFDLKAVGRLFCAEAFSIFYNFRSLEHFVKV